MNFIKRFFLIISFWLLSGCARHAYMTTWKVPNIQARSFNKILVVGVIHDSDLTLRRNLEVHFAEDMHNMGYTVVSALAEFGPKGLANLDQEATYQMLCNRGIDGVITIALIDKRKESGAVPAQLKYYSSLYYYNRMWNYKNIAANLNKQSLDSSADVFKWESVFFDVTSLEPIYTVQSKSFDLRSLENEALRYGKALANSMHKNKVLRKQTQVKTDSLKAF